MTLTSEESNIIRHAMEKSNKILEEHKMETLFSYRYAFALGYLEATKVFTSR